MLADVYFRYTMLDQLIQTTPTIDIVFLVLLKQSKNIILT